MPTLIILKAEINDVIEIVKPFEGSGLLIKSISEKFTNDAKEQNRGFLWMLLGASLLGNLLTGKITVRGPVATGQDF